MSEPKTTEPTAEAALSPLAEELTKIPIEGVTEDFLSNCTNAQLEEFQRYLYVIGLTIKTKAEMAHKILEFRVKCADKARRLRALAKDERAAILATLPDEEAREVLKAMDAKEEAPAAPTQHLTGSFISRDAADVMPGGSEKT